MKKYAFLLILIFNAGSVFCQPCILTNQININTGFDPLTNLTLPVGINDPRWIIDNAFNIPGAVNNAPAIACVPNGGAAANPNAAWIGFASLSQYVTNNPTVGFYLITYRFPFRTCLDDSLFFNFNIANDNYCSELRIDGIPTGFSQPVGLPPSNWSTFSNYLYSGYYFAGNHTIEFDIQNYNVAGAMNPHMLNVFGTLTGQNNSILTFANPVNCICNVVINDTITANFSQIYPNPCDSLTVQFTDLSTAINSTVTSWQWDFGDGNTSIFQNPLHTYATAGNYLVTLIATNNLSNADTFSVNVQAIANAQATISAIANPANICAGASTTITGSGANTYTYTGGVLDGIPFYPANTSTYTVTGTFANGCTNTTTVTVTIYSAPNITANVSPASVCIGNPITLNGNGGVSYVWSGGVTNGIAFIPVGNNTYTVTGTDINGCTNTASISINPTQGLNISILPEDILLCKTDSVQLVASGGNNYVWTATLGLNTYTGSTVWAKPTVNSVYTVTGADATGCSGTATASIEILDGINLAVSKDRDAECGNHTIQLSVSGANNYIWTPANLLSNPTGAITNANVFETTTFYVTGMVGTCLGMDSITVTAYNNDETGLFIPTAFSPNGDGKNDCVRVANNANFTKFYFAVYNRYGQQVFETDNADLCWNGQFNGKDCDLGVYYYYLKAETNCGKILKKGDITLVR